jgi:predicted RNA-binding protein with RPS1 domain
MNLPLLNEVYEGTVVRVYPHYAILLFDEGWTGLLHISELSNNFVHSFTSFVTVGNIYQVKVIAVDAGTQNVKVSLKAMTAADRHKALKRKKIDPNEVDFKALEASLPDWIKAENALGEDKDGH